MKITKENLKSLLENDEKHSYIGLRATLNPVSVGEYTPDSYEWAIEDRGYGKVVYDEAGEPVELNGTSAVALRSHDRDQDIDRALDLINDLYMAAWPGAKMIVIAGKMGEYGEDEQEIVICDAVRIA
jgi:hypothetical protein